MACRGSVCQGEERANLRSVSSLELDREFVARACLAQLTCVFFHVSHPHFHLYRVSVAQSSSTSPHLRPTQNPYRASGIGLETALQFASEGARLCLGDINEEAILKAAELVKSRYPTSEAIGLKCDVSKEPEVKALVQGAVDQFGRLDVLVSRFVTFFHSGSAI